MNAPEGPSNNLASRVQQFLDERRRLGFKLQAALRMLPAFERFVANADHTGPLTIDLMVQWASQVHARHMVDGQADRGTVARRLVVLRPFMRWLRQFEPATEVPDDSSVGALPGRVAPHTRAQPSLAGRRISPHTLRHSRAMHLLQSGVDISVIALWLGHESPTTTHQYIEADLAMKEKALSRLQDPGVVARRFRADDALLDFLKTL